jgi:predicted O-methyltransferase YrrM
MKRPGLVSLSSLLAASMLAGPVSAAPPSAVPPSPAPRPVDDAKVRAFLDRARHDWHDLNVPYEDGQVLHDLIVARKLTRGLEIGTSTGHSGIWIAWAMAKTGGRLVTLEIDERRYRIARKNFEEAGVAPWVDARLGDAHEIVKELPGPFDFVFSDADKEWYPQYFKDLEAKMTVGGCFTAHNVLAPFGGIADFLAYVRSRPSFTTTIDRTSRAGISVSCRTR